MAVDLKLKSLGLDGEQANKKAEKKKMKDCLAMYTSSSSTTAEAALHDLLLAKAGAASQ